jgi:hypothetical protein
MYKSDGKYAVWAENTVIAIAFPDEIRILQGMDRMETIQQIAKDCPEFLSENNWTVNQVPRLFSESTGKKFKQQNPWTKK